MVTVLASVEHYQDTVDALSFVSRMKNFDASSPPLAAPPTPTPITTTVADSSPNSHHSNFLFFASSLRGSSANKPFKSVSKPR
jgi:hypothetical protein